MFVSIGGIEQWVTIKAQNRDNPGVLILHGGPGAAFSPFDDSAFGNWRQEFTVVQWDQRGAGRTYGKSGPSIEPTMTIDRMVKDGIELGEFLAAHLHKDKIVIFGGSWGSILGVYMARSRPDLFYAYVGTAQIVDSGQRALAATYSGLLATAQKANDQTAVDELVGLGPPPWNSLQKLFAYFRWTNVYEAKTSTPFDMAVAAEYSSSEERAAWAAAMTMSVTHFFGSDLDGPLMHIDLPALGTQFGIPVFIIQGRDDLKAPLDIARNYFDQIKAPHKQFLVAPRTGHEPTSISMDMILKVLIEKVRPLCRSPARQ